MSRWVDNDKGGGGEDRTHLFGTVRFAVALGVFETLGDGRADLLEGLLVAGESVGEGSHDALDLHEDLHRLLHILQGVGQRGAQLTGSVIFIHLTVGWETF